MSQDADLIDTPTEARQIARFLTWLVTDCGYLSPVLIGQDRYACILPLLFTHAIITGRIGDTSGYCDRWCYSSKEAAQAALEAWDGTGEPQGWHRHPGTGRRRDPAAGTEWIDP